MESFVSVIVPIYNAEKYLKDCIESIINQTYKNIELILVDDGSNDDSLEICKNYVQKFSNIKIIHTENKGVSAARNIGIENCTGDYVAFIDADDYIHPEYIYQLISLMDDDISITICDFTSNIKELQESKKQKKSVLSTFDFISCLNEKWSIWPKLYRRNLFNNIEFKTKYAIAEDLLFNIEIISKNNPIRVKTIDSKLYYHRIATDSAMHCSYSEKYLNGVIAELESYNILEKLSCEKLCPSIVFNGLHVFYNRYFSLSENEQNKYKNDYIQCKLLVKNYKKKLLKNIELNRDGFIKFIILTSPFLYKAFLKIKNIKN